MAPEELRNVSVEPALRLLYTSSVEVDPPMVVGGTPYGERRIIPIKGGAFAGPRLSGKILPGGADWQVIRTDGVAELEARAKKQNSWAKWYERLSGFCDRRFGKNWKDQDPDFWDHLIKY